jgi:transcriptional regulator with GAF, ATPase, and Fis domain
VNCGAIPRELFESELFGYEKGAHSTATARKAGLWEITHGGTLFLDEIADLSLDHQVKVLRALDEGEIRPVGAVRSVKVDARVVAATNRDLSSMMEAGEFREDLYHRLRGFMIYTPALRDHTGDIPLLAEHFWRSIARSDRCELSAEVLGELATYGWPGNARELKLVLSTLYNLFGDEGLTADHVRAVFEFEGQARAARAEAVAPSDPGRHRMECLRHLRRADEVVRTTKVTLRPVVSERRTDPDTVSRVLAATARRLGELELLLSRPLLFHRERTYDAVHGLKEGLGSFHRLLERDPQQALLAWERELSGGFKLAQSAIFEEVERVLEQA